MKPPVATDVGAGDEAAVARRSRRDTLWPMRIAAVLVVLALAPACEKKPATPPEGGDVVCTMEAKICPDGSAVGRSGPNCEFAPCPSGGEVAPEDGGVEPDPASAHAPAPAPAHGCTKDAKVCDDGTVLARTEPGCEFPACPGA